MSYTTPVLVVVVAIYLGIGAQIGRALLHQYDQNPTVGGWILEPSRQRNKTIIFFAALFLWPVVLIGSLLSGTRNA